MGNVGGVANIVGQVAKFGNMDYDKVLFRLEKALYKSAWSSMMYSNDTIIGKFFISKKHAYISGITYYVVLLSEFCHPNDNTQKKYGLIANHDYIYSTNVGSGTGLTPSIGFYDLTDNKWVGNPSKEAQETILDFLVSTKQVQMPQNSNQDSNQGQNQSGGSPSRLCNKPTKSGRPCKNIYGMCKYH